MVIDFVFYKNECVNDKMIKHTNNRKKTQTQH